MATSTLAATAATLLFVLTMFYAGFSDLTTYKIRNTLVLLLLLAYVVMAPIAGFAAYEMARSVAVALAVLLCAFALFAAGWLGGGDAKLAAVTTLWLGADKALVYLLCMGIVGGLFALAVYLSRMWPLPKRLANTAWIVRLHARGGKLPYGVAITLAALFVLPSTPWVV